MPQTVHPTAIVDPAAKLGDGVVVGPYCIVGADVELGDGVQLKSHVNVQGRTRIGAETVVYPFASLGTEPQDLKYHGEPSELVIGRRNRIREHVTMNTGTEGGGMLTRVGDNCLFMVNAHVAHDCVVGDNVILANNATLAGHVVVGDHAVIGGLAAVHQFVRIGAHAMIGGMSGVEADVIPFGLVNGERAKLQGLNLVGLERRGFPREHINSLRAAYRALFAAEGTLAERVDSVSAQFAGLAEVVAILDFIRNRGPRALTQPKAANG